MARAIGEVKSFEHGTFYIKDTKGYIYQLKVGDTIMEGDQVFGAHSNGADAKIVIDVLLAGAGDLVISETGALTFDTSILEGVFSHHDAVVYVNSVQEALAMAAAAKGMEEAPAEHKAPTGAEAAAGTEAGDETAAGNVVTDSERIADVFDSRTGAITDVTTDLRVPTAASAEVTAPLTDVNLLPTENSIPTADWIVVTPDGGVVNEGGLPGGNLGGDMTSNGILNITTGGDTINAVGGVVINGVDVTNGGTIAGLYGDLEITLSGGTYYWTYTLNDNAPHTNPNATGAADQFPEEAFTVVVTDDDGDVSEPANLVIQINDDGPTLTVNVATEYNQEGLAISVDESVGTDRAAPGETANGNNDDGVGLGRVTTELEGGLISLFDLGGQYGADGAGSTSGSLSFIGIPESGLATNLSSTAGGAITLYLDNGVIVGNDANGGAPVFTIEIVNTGTVDAPVYQLQTTLYEAIVQDNNELFDEAKQLLVEDGAVQLQYVVTRVDSDGDSVTQSDAVNLISGETSYFAFEDDGPSISLTEAEMPALVVDESTMGDNNTQDFSGLFATPLFGADGPAATDSLTYSLGVNAGSTGLTDSGTGLAVNLFLSGGQVVGSTATTEGGVTTGNTVFTVSVDGSGNVTLDQMRAVIHSLPDAGTDSNEPKTLLSENLITLTATAEDKDGDTSSATANIGGTISFLDDGPVINWVVPPLRSIKVQQVTRI